MTLPNAVLFPGTLLPLHIFEPRYRRMLAECLESHRIFGIGLVADQAATARGEQPHAVAGVGLIRTCIAQADGTSHLVLQGLARVAIAEYCAGDPAHGYPVARIRPLANESAAAALDRQPLVGAVKQLAKVRSRLGLKVPKEVVDSLLAMEDAAQLADVVSYTLLDNMRDKQLMLETLNVQQRLHRLVGLLQEQIGRFELWRTVQGRLPNDHVGNN
jgi:Lon protease-like protein